MNIYIDYLLVTQIHLAFDGHQCLNVLSYPHPSCNARASHSLPFHRKETDTYALSVWYVDFPWCIQICMIMRKFLQILPLCWVRGKMKVNRRYSLSRTEHANKIIAPTWKFFTVFRTHSRNLLKCCRWCFKVTVRYGSRARHADKEPLEYCVSYSKGRGP